MLGKQDAVGGGGLRQRIGNLDRAGVADGNSSGQVERQHPDIQTGAEADAAMPRLFEFRTVFLNTLAHLQGSISSPGWVVSAANEQCHEAVVATFLDDAVIVAHGFRQQVQTIVQDAEPIIGVPFLRNHACHQTGDKLERVDFVPV